MKPGFLFLATFAFTIAVGALFMRSTRAAEPVDAFVTPVPSAPPGTSATILPPGTYFAERSDGVRLSGWVHSSGTSQFPMPGRQPAVRWPQAKTPAHNPGLRFVPVNPSAQGLTQARPSR